MVKEEINVGKGKFQVVMFDAFIWCVVYVLSLTFSVYFNIAPPEIKEAGGYVVGSAFSRLWSGAAADSVPAATSTLPAAAVPVSPAEPIRVVVPKIGVDAPVSNPTSADIAVLDNALLSGAVRYPGSGTFDDNENIFLFGHSSYLPVVHNQAFRAFNRLGQLELGDEVQLFSDKRVYTYKVTKMELVNAAEALVNFNSGAKKVILSTCDSFGQKSDRFVVEATFVESHLL